MADDYIELVLLWSDNAKQDVASQNSVRKWVEQRQLTTSKMISGLLLLGTKSAVEKAFSVSLANVQPPVELPVPELLSSHVASITFPKPRSYHP